MFNLKENYEEISNIEHKLASFHGDEEINEKLSLVKGKILSLEDILKVNEPIEEKLSEVIFDVNDQILLL